jgi:hypothetical protein
MEYCGPLLSKKKYCGPGHEIMARMLSSTPGFSQTS